jgi:hypothetical protein
VVIQRLRTTGYTAEEREMLRHLGLSDEEIGVCLAAAVDTVIEPDGVAAWGSLRDYGGTLRELGSILMQLPVAFPLQDN